MLGDHRLLCGDSTDAASVARLLGGGASIDLVVTDPPYGVEYQSDLTPEEAKALHRRRDGLEVANDGLGADGTTALVRDALTIAGIRPGGVFYVCAPPGPMHVAIQLGMSGAALDPRQYIVWVKDAFVFGRSDYHYRHEFLIYGWAKGAGHHFIDDRTQDTVWMIDRPRKSTEHPTMKPLELFERCVSNSSTPGDVVYDPFGGSGTTLIASENHGRRARIMEVDPAYADVIVDRYARHTNTAPVTPVREDEEPEAPS